MGKPKKGGVIFAERGAIFKPWVILRIKGWRRATAVAYTTGDHRFRVNRLRWIPVGGCWVEEGNPGQRVADENKG